MSKLPKNKEFTQEVRAELQNLGAIVISKVLVAFKTGTEPEPEKLKELELVFDCKSNGKTWYKYEPSIGG
ncbi:MAG: hypothetical protein IJE59_04000 [Clostridia bacterium]|nr:hypothetical protein [Clostridia bacterium]